MSINENSLVSGTAHRPCIQLLSSLSSLHLPTHAHHLLLPQFALMSTRYLLAPRSPLYFSAELREFLATGDGNPHTKKPAEQRQSELRESFLPMLAQVSRCGGARCRADLAFASRCAVGTQRVNYVCFRL